MKSIHLTEDGELTIDAAPGAKTRPIGNTELRVDPRRSGCGACQGPAVYTDAGSDGKARPDTDADLPIRRRGTGVLGELIDTDLTACGRELEGDRILALQPLS